MQILKRLDPSEQKFHGGVVTIGNYDGLHVGHQSLLRKMAEVSGPRVVLTFDPHPLQVLHPERSLRRLFPREDLIEQLPSYGIDALWIIPFDREFARMPARDFLESHVAEAFRPKHFVAGYDFAFGSGREGTLDVLQAWAATRAMIVDVVSPLRLAGEIVSSRRVRDLITKGDVHGAELLLKRPFYLRGEVVRGAGRGAQIGVPTLNQKVVNETLPAMGVYASRTRFEGKTYPSVTNVGTNPTFDSAPTVKVETHVLDAKLEARDKVVDVDLLERLREERKFASVDELVRQIQTDIKKARSIHEARR